MDSKSPVSASVVMLVAAVFVLGGLAGYIAGTNHATQTAAAVAAPPSMGSGGMCAMEGKEAGKGVAGEASACPMMKGKDKAGAAKTEACPKGGEKGACADKDNCPDAGKCPTPDAKSAVKPGVCPMGGDKDKAATAKSGACPTGGDKAGKPATSAKAAYGCPMDAAVKSDKPGKCPKCGMALVKSL